MDFMNILLITYFFPPDSSSGAFRPMYFARDLQAAGHQVTVLTVRRGRFFPYQNQDRCPHSDGRPRRPRRPGSLFDLHRRLLVNLTIALPAATISRSNIAIGPEQPASISIGMATPPKKSRIQVRRI